MEYKYVHIWNITLFYKCKYRYRFQFRFKYKIGYICIQYTVYVFKLNTKYLFKWVYMYIVYRFKFKHILSWLHLGFVDPVVHFNPASGGSGGVDKDGAGPQTVAIDHDVGVDKRISWTPAICKLNNHFTAFLFRIDRNYHKAQYFEVDSDLRLEGKVSTLYGPVVGGERGPDSRRFTAYW
jgi:hypothetical protein